MFKIILKAPSIKFPKLLNKQIMVGAGVHVVNNYKLRMNKGIGIDRSGNLKPHKPLHEITLANRKKGGEGAKPLADSTNMLSSFRVDPVKTTSKKAVMNFPQSEAWKAGIHQKGITIKPKREGGRLRVPFGDKFLFLKRVTIPARRHVGFSKKDIHDATKFIEVTTAKRLREIEIGKT